MSAVRVTASFLLDADERDALEREVLGGAGLISSDQASAWADVVLRRELVRLVARAKAARGPIPRRGRARPKDEPGRG